MRIVFMGSGSFACPAVSSLLGAPGLEVLAVVTQPDRPRGRALHMSACPVKALVEPKGVRVITPEKVGEIEEKLRELNADLFVVADYGQYIPTRIWSMPPHKTINIHPSLLPKYRGAAPIPWAIARGDTITGVSIQYVTAKMDAGDLLAQETFVISPDDTSITLEARLAEEGARMLLGVIERIAQGEIHPTPQNEADASHARKLSKQDATIHWNHSAVSIHNKVRAFQPWPGAVTRIRTGALQVSKSRVEDAKGTPGWIIEMKGDGPLIATGEGSLRLLEVQPEGKKSMPGSAWICGSRLNEGEPLI